MLRQLMYMKYRSDQNERREAWIGKIEVSKSVQTLYFNNMAFKIMKEMYNTYSNGINDYD